MLLYKVLMALCHLFLTSVLQRNEIYLFKQLQIYDKKTEKSNDEHMKTKK